MARAIDGGTLRDNLTDLYGDGNRLVYLNDVLDLIDELPTLTPPNEPLTLEQLLEMDNIPIWVVDITINRWEWCYWKDGFAYSCEAHPEYYDPDEYGLWLAYRRPKEGKA